MGEAQPNNDNNITLPNWKGNDIVEDEQYFNYSKFLKGKVREKISEYKLNCLQNYLFGQNMILSDCGAFIAPALKQIERFMFYWMNDLDEETRKTIIWHRLTGIDSDSRTYSEFLDTPLWKYESSLYKIMCNFTCSMCKNQYWPTYLVLHHKSYDHLGSELEHPEDVTVLCRECHKKVHETGGDDELEQ